MKKAGKWDDFRARKLVIINNYLAVKRKQQALLSMIKLYFLHGILKTVKVKIQSVKDYRELQWVITMIQLKLIIRFKRNMKQFRGLFNKLNGNIRHTLIASTMFMRPQKEGFMFLRPHRILASALKVQQTYEHFSPKLDRLFKKFRFMQQKIRGRWLIIDTKLDLLEIYWFKNLE